MGYLFKSIDDTREEAEKDWFGGIDIQVLQDSENIAYGFHFWFSSQNDTISLDKNALQTCHGLSKFPYVRDVRRSVGLDYFVLASRHMKRQESKEKTGTIFPDRIAIGCYDIDFHNVNPSVCELPEYVQAFKGNHDTYPFYIPIRALTNKKIRNLIVSGKNIAQSFVANAGTRLHPIEWALGVASGAAASYFVQNTLQHTRALIEQVESIQSIIRKYAPTEWTIDGQIFPPTQDSSMFRLPPALDIFCPESAEYDHGLNFCADEDFVYGPFPAAFSEICEDSNRFKCESMVLVTIHATNAFLYVPRVEKSIYLEVLKSRLGSFQGKCPIGTSPSWNLNSMCLEGTSFLFGPFSGMMAFQCLELFHNDSQCLTQRWPVEWIHRLRNFSTSYDLSQN
jgi:hypothetical protein